MKLIHYGKANLTTLDPHYHGTGYPGEEARRRANAYPGDYVERVYYYREGAKPEPGVVGQSRQQYILEVPSEHLYDLGVDSLGLLGRYRFPNGRADLTLVEKAIREAGYWGYVVPNAAAVFVPLDVASYGVVQ